MCAGECCDPAGVQSMLQQLALPAFDLGDHRVREPKAAARKEETIPSVRSRPSKYAW